MTSHQLLRRGFLNPAELDDGIAEVVLKINPDISTLLGPGAANPDSDADTKTIRMHDRDFVFGDGDIGFHLTNMSVTVTRMFAPATRQPYLQIFFSYSVTSNGWRTGNQLHESPGISQGLEFFNRNGGTMWSWGFPADDIVVQCGWNQHYKLHHFVSNVDVSWFDAWKKVAHTMSGTMYPC